MAQTRNCGPIWACSQDKDPNRGRDPTHGRGLKYAAVHLTTKEAFSARKVCSVSRTHRTVWVRPWDTRKEAEAAGKNLGQVLAMLDQASVLQICRCIGLEERNSVERGEQVPPAQESISIAAGAAVECPLRLLLEITLERRQAVKINVVMVDWTTRRMALDGIIRLHRMAHRKAGVGRKGDQGPTTTVRCRGRCRGRDKGIMLKSSPTNKPDRGRE